MARSQWCDGCIPRALDLSVQMPDLGWHGASLHTCSQSCYSVAAWAVSLFTVAVARRWRVCSAVSLGVCDATDFALALSRVGLLSMVCMTTTSARCVDVVARCSC